MSKLKMVEELHASIREGDDKVFARFMKDPLTSTIIDQVDDNGYTALYLACCSSHEDKKALGYVIELHKQKASIDIKGDDRETPLFMAVHNQMFATAKYLVTAGAKINEMNGTQGDTALHCAARYGFVELCRFLLVEGNANLNSRNTAMETPLFVACKSGRHEAAYELLLKNPNRNLADQDGKNPLFIASENGHKGCVALLKVEKEYLKEAKAEADVEARHCPISINNPKTMAKRSEQAKAQDESEMKAAREEPMPEMIRIQDVEPKAVSEDRTHDPLTGQKLPPAFKTVVGASPAPVIPAGVVKPMPDTNYGGSVMNVGTGTGQKFKKKSIFDMIGQDEALVMDVRDVNGHYNSKEQKKK